MELLWAYEAMSAGFAGEEAEPPADFVDNVMTEILSQSAVLVGSGSRRPYLRRTLTAAALLAVVTVIGIYGVWGNLGEAPLQSDRIGELSAPAPMAATPVTHVISPETEAIEGEQRRFGDEGANWGATESADPWEYGYPQFFEVQNEDGPMIMPSAGDIVVLEVDTRFLEMYISLLGLYPYDAQWSWEAMSTMLGRFGYDYVYDEERFSVEDPYNPGSYLYGSLVLDPDLPGGLRVSVFGYRFRQGDIERRIEVRAMDDGVFYYYAVPYRYGGGRRTVSFGSLREFILFGQRNVIVIGD